MPRSETVQRFESEPDDLEARIVAAISQVGPRNVAAIARLTGAHKETVRYKMKKRLDKLGFKFQPEVDYGKLGLALHWATLNFKPVARLASGRILRALNRSGYLIHFTKIVPNGYHIAHVTIPRGRTDDYNDFLKSLKDSRILESFEFEEVIATRHKPMDPTHFNFQLGRWEVEWDRVKASKGSPLPLSRQTPKMVADLSDMLLIKELQLDAMQHVVEIAKKLKVNEKTIQYHYMKHVVNEKLIPNYRVRWMQDLTKTLAHSVAFTKLIFDDLRHPEYSRVQNTVSKIPFLWSETLIKGGKFIATLSVPATEILALNVYLSEELGDVTSKMTVGYLKPNESSNFTIPYNMYVANGWRFDTDEMEDAVIAAKAPVEK